MTRAEFDAACENVKRDGCPRNFDMPQIDRWISIHRVLTSFGYRLMFQINGQPARRAVAEALIEDVRP